MPSEDDVFDQLMAVINSRKGQSADASYTAKLLAGGVDRISAKVTEEAGELAEAAGEAGEEGRAHFVYETADLVFHTMVLMACRDVSLDDVRAELARRFGVSGLEEKASREPKPE